MELLYIGLVEYKLFNPDSKESEGPVYGYNFSVKYNISYNSVTEILSIENTNVSFGVFGNKISNLTLLLGENGAGKTTVLRNILKFSALKIYVLYDEISGHITVKKGSRIHIKNEGELKSQEILVYDYDVHNRFNLDQTDIFYYSPILNFISDDSTIDHYDLSITKKVETYVNLKTFPLIKLNQDQTLDQLYFIHDNKDFIQEIFETRKLPTLNVSPRNIEFDESNPGIEAGNIKNAIFSKFINPIVKRIDKSFNESKEINYDELYNLFFSETILGIFSEYLNSQLYSRNINEFYKDITGKISEMKEITEINDFYKNFKFLNFKVDHEFPSIDYELFKNFIKSNISSIKYEGSLQEPHVSIDFQDLDVQKIQDEFFAIFKSDFIPFSLTWTGLSSGEQNILNYFSSFYKVLKTKNNVQSSSLILIDEGESTLHPHWKKRYINWSLKFFNQYVSGKYQIILTTNDPILLSDVPIQNVRFVGKGGNNEVIFLNDQLVNNHQTFAANIHNLYADSFFMKDGLIGDFAISIINNVIYFLRDKKSSIDGVENGMEYSRKIISLIGEPILREKLSTLYNQKIKLDSNQQLTILEDRVSKIEKRLRDINL